MSKTIDGMVVYHADCLHEGVADGRADEIEAVVLQVPAHLFGYSGLRRDLPDAVPAVLDRDIVDIAPQVACKRRIFFEKLQESAGVFDRGLYFQAIADDAGVLHQAVNIFLAVAGDAPGIEVVERLAIVVPLPQDGQPAETGLGAFEDQHLEEPAIVVQRDTPLLVVIGNILGVATAPCASFDQLLIPWLSGIMSTTASFLFKINKIHGKRNR